MSRAFTISIFLLLSWTGSIAQVKPLDYFIATGTENSPLLKDIRNQLSSNSADSLLVRASHLPRVDFNGLLYYAPVVNGWGYSDVITNIGNFTSTVNISQAIFNKKTLDALYSKYGLAGQSLNNAAVLTLSDVKKAITAKYLDAYALFEEIRYGREILQSVNDEDRLLQELVRNGIYRQTDYLTFLLEKQSFELSLSDLQINFRKELSNLKQLCGISDTATYGLVLPDIEPPVSWSPQNSPFFHRFRIDSLQILNERTLIDRSYKPEFNWFTDAGLINNEPSLIYKNFGLSLGLSMKLPVYDGNQRKLNYRKLQNSEDTRQGYRDFFRQQYDQQLASLNSELRQTQALIPGIRKQLETAQMVVKQEHELLNRGEVNITDYILALKNLVSFRQRLTTYEVKVRQIINEITYWEQNK